MLGAKVQYISAHGLRQEMRIEYEYSTLGGTLVYGGQGREIPALLVTRVLEEA